MVHQLHVGFRCHLPTGSTHMTRKTHEQPDQGSPEWLEARRGILTASSIAPLITPSRLQTASNDRSRALINELLAERITGFVEETYVSHDMLRGQWDEPIARAAYEQHYAPVQEVGFMVRTINGDTLGY